MFALARASRRDWADQKLGVVQLKPALCLLSFFKVAGPSRVDEFEGKRYSFLLQVLTTGGGLADGVEIDPLPLWSIDLRYRDRGDWRPFIRPLVALNGFRYGVDGAVVTTDGVQVSMRLNLAIPEQERFQAWMRGKTRGSLTLNYGNFAFGFEADATPEATVGQ